MAAASGDRPSSKANPQDVPQDWNLVNGAAAIGPGYPPEGRHPALSSSLNPEGLVKALQRRWLVATTLGLICGSLAATATWFFLPPGKISARAILRVATFSQYLVSPIGDRADFQNFQKSQVALVKSRGVLDTALKKPGVSQLGIVRAQDNPLDWLERELKVDYSLGPEILSISLNGDDPDELKVLVDVIKNVYLDEFVQKDRIKREQKLDTLKDFSVDYARRIHNLRRELKVISDKPDSNDPKKLRTLNEDFLAQTNKDLLTVRSELLKLKAETTLPPANPKGNSETVVPERFLDDFLKNDSAYKGLLVEKDKLQSDIEKTRRLDKRGENSPVLKRFEDDLKAVQSRIDARRNEVRPQIVKDYQSKLKADEEMNQFALQRRITIYETLQKNLQKDKDFLEKNLNKTDTEPVGIEALRAQLELQQEEDIIKRVGSQVEAMRVELKAPDRVTELDPEHGAYIVHPDETKRKIVASGLGGFGTLGLILFVVAWVEYRPRRITSVDEIQDLGLKLVGTVPALPSRRQLRLLNANGDGEALWQNILTESVDTARTMLLHAARSERTQVVMVTSATGGEGKTSLSSHLAASLARAGRKTLLLDCDLRNPALHRLFGTSRTPGMCEVLRGDTELAEVIWQTPAHGLWMIPAGRCDSLALQALAQDHFKKIAEPLRAGYDFIVVDSAPVLPVADSLLIGQCVDAVIFSILHDVSRLPKVYAAHQRLEKLGIRMLGAVVSGTHVDAYGPEYQYLTQFED
jgi:capsular exopolysaccharide synthesis family protein